MLNAIKTIQLINIHVCHDGFINSTENTHSCIAVISTEPMIYKEAETTNCRLLLEINSENYYYYYYYYFFIGFIFIFIIITAKLDLE